MSLKELTDSIYSQARDQNPLKLSEKDVQEQNDFFDFLNSLIEKKKIEKCRKKLIKIKETCLLELQKKCNFDAEFPLSRLESVVKNDIAKISDEKQKLRLNSILRLYVNSALYLNFF